MFDLLTLKDHHFMLLSCGSLVPIGIKIGSFYISKYHVQKFDNRRTNDECMNERMENVVPRLARLAQWRYNNFQMILSVMWFFCNS